MNKFQKLQKKSLIYNIKVIITILKDKIKEKYKIIKKIGLTNNRTEQFSVYLREKIKKNKKKIIK